MILHLGVIDLPYAPPQSQRKAPKRPSKRPRKARARRVSNLSTGDVATFLEDRYHVLEVFSQQHDQDIANDVAGSVKGAVESLLMGAPASIDPFGAAASDIADRMKKFIATGEMEMLGFPGVPTQASIDRASGRRRSGRFKTRRATGKSVSFVDTGLFSSSLTAWIDG